MEKLSPTPKRQKTGRLMVSLQEALKHKDESAHTGREHVAAYVDYTHYVERLQMSVAGRAAHQGEAAHKKHATPKHKLSGAAT